MKPTRNRVFCTQCFKQKMLFENERKALNFIRYNSGAVMEESGYAPVRAYYCTACGGWHVTHHKRDEDSIDRKLNTIYDDVRVNVDELIKMSSDGDYDGIYKFGINAHFRIEGYKKLANHLKSPTHIETSAKISEELDDIIINVFNTLYSIAVDFANKGTGMSEIKVYNWAISIGWSMLGFINKPSEIKDELKERINEVKSIRDEYNRIIMEKSMHTTPEERLRNKLDKYINNITKFLDAGEYESASRQIHFAVVYVRKKCTLNNKDVVSPYIDKLIVYQHQIPEEYMWHPKE